jgi:diguanylate cyclase (GGDEF)-like protein
VGLVVFDAALGIQAINQHCRYLLGCSAADPASCRDMPALIAQATLLDQAAAGLLLETCRSAVEHSKGLEPVLICPQDPPRSLTMGTRPAGPGIWLAVFEDVTIHRNSVNRAIEGMMRDPLTGLANRQLFADRVAASLAAETASGCAIVLVDLDRFKSVNDTLGHPIGDALLRLVAERLRGMMRAEDLIARLGGDEFAVLLRLQSERDSIEALANRVVELLGRPYLIEGHLVNIGASAGVALGGVDGAHYDALLKNADLALYHAKASGRGTFSFFDIAMDARAHARRTLELDLRRAIALGEFALHYQPQIELSSSRLEGFEALIRWHHPTRGMVPPAEFIPLAEEIGLIGRLGDWVMHEACREATNWPDGLRVAVNVSPHQFAEPGRLIATIETALARSSLPGHRLEVEITESVLLRNEVSVLETLHQMRALGVRVAMDDFGTGYSSLSQLQSFPFNKIKIDRSFVTHAGNATKQNAVISAITRLGESLGMTTIAEGIETTEQLARVRAGGCTAVQGYLFSRPVPPAELQRLIGALTPRRAETSEPGSSSHDAVAPSALPQPPPPARLHGGRQPPSRGDRRTVARTQRA